MLFPPPGYNLGLSAEELYYEIKFVDQLYTSINLWLHQLNPKMSQDRNIYTWEGIDPEKDKMQFFCNHDYYTSVAKKVKSGAISPSIVSKIRSDDYAFWGEKFFFILEREIDHVLSSHFCILNSEGKTSWKELCSEDTFFRVTENVLLKTGFEKIEESNKAGNVTSVSSNRVVLYTEKYEKYKGVQSSLWRLLIEDNKGEKILFNFNCKLCDSGKIKMLGYSDSELFTYAKDVWPLTEKSTEKLLKMLQESHKPFLIPYPEATGVPGESNRNGAGIPTRVSYDDRTDDFVRYTFLAQGEQQETLVPIYARGVKAKDALPLSDLNSSIPKDDIVFWVVDVGSPICLLHLLSKNYKN